MPSLKGVVILALMLGPTAGASGGTEPVADVVTLRDGTRVLGELIEAPRRPTALLVRRAWVREHAPDWARRWEAAESSSTARAVAQRRERLTDWRRDRALTAPGPGGPDKITPWVERELARLRPGADATSTPLMSVRLNSSDIQKVTRHPRTAAGLLRQAWLVRTRNPETLSVDTLRGELEGRGLLVSERSSPSVDRLLPPQLETDAVWLSRRAATEILNDPGLRFLRYRGMVLPDSGSGAPPGLEALPALGGLVTGALEDPLPGCLRRLGSQGKAGAVVTTLEIAPDMSMAAVEVSLWLRQAGDHWAPVGSRTARVRPQDLGPDAGKDLATDPQVEMAFRLVEAVGLREVGPELKRQALSMGAATRRALAQARTMAQTDLTALALPVFDRPDDDPTPAAGPDLGAPATPAPPERP
jgi:hypothetical protein